MRTGSLLRNLVGAFAAIMLATGCGSGGVSDTGAGDPAAADLPEVAEAGDVPGDAVAEAHSDAQVEVPADLPPDPVADAPADGAAELPGDLPGDGLSDGLADAVAEVPADLPPDPVADTPADEAAELPGDLPGDVPSDGTADHGVDAASDAPVDTVSDASGDTPGDVDAEVSAPDAPFVGPLDDVLRLNHVQVKGTHNSYHVESEGTLPQWKFTHAPLDVQLRDLGVRQIELDVHWDGDLQGFTVFHIPLADPGTTCRTFKECLTVVKTWSDANPGHQLLYILVEPKDEVDDEPISGHYDALDAEILSVWPRERLLVPDDVRGSRASLTEALQKDGWPTIGQARSKAFFLLLDSSTHRDAYLEGHPNLEGRVLFARGSGGEPWCGVIEHGNPVRDADAITRDVGASIYLVRTTADEVDGTDEANSAGAEAARSLGAHLISSDFPAPKPEGGYWFDLPGGTPSRCNPVTAPTGCTSVAIENFDGLPAARVHPADCILDPACTHVLVSCHRGYHQIHPENSIGGIRGVADVGADAAEVDVRVTKDDVLVLMHDSEVDRTTDGTGNIEDKTFAEVQALNLEGNVDDKPEDRKVPLFLDALKIAKERDLVLYVDLMTDHLDLVIDLIKNGEGGPYYAQALIRDGLDTTSVMAQKDPNLIVMPYVKNAEDFEAVRTAIPGVRIVEMWVGGPDPDLASTIRAAGVKITQDVMGTGDVFAGFGDYTMWGQFVESGVNMPQTDWPTFLVPAVQQFNDTGLFPESGPLVQ